MVLFNPAVLLAIPALFLALWMYQVVYIGYRVRRSGGVFAPILTQNPLISIYYITETGYMQSRDRMLEQFNRMIDRGDPSRRSNTVEHAVFGRRAILTRDPEHIKAVLATKFSDFGKGTLVHESASPFLGDSIFTTDGQLWQRSRALLRPMFTKDRLRDIDIFSKYSEKMLDNLPASGQTVDICDVFYRMTLDVSTDFLLGQPVGALDNPKIEFSQAFTDVQRFQTIRTIMFNFRHFLPGSGKYFNGIKVIDSFIKPYIDSALRMNIEDLEKLSKSDKEFTFLHNITLHSRDRKVIRDQISAILIAGRDTTAATLSWAMYELSNKPAVWAKLRNQILEQVGPTRTPSYEDLKNLTYLTHTINETLRLYPSVPFNLRSCLEDSFLPTPAGEPDIAVFKGDVCVYSTLAMQRRADLYPPVSETFAHPATFSPDRWEHWTPKPWQFVPFNGGPRICIGQNFAMTSMAFTMVRILQKYERLEYRGDWDAQFLKAELVGCPGNGVPVALFEPAQV